MKPELLDEMVQVHIDNMHRWRAHLVDLTPAQLRALNEAAIGLADAICALLFYRRRPAIAHCPHCDVSLLEHELLDGEACPHCRLVL